MYLPINTHNQFIDIMKDTYYSTNALISIYEDVEFTNPEWILDIPYIYDNYKERTLHDIKEEFFIQNDTEAMQYLTENFTIIAIYPEGKILYRIEG